MKAVYLLTYLLAVQECGLSALLDDRLGHVEPQQLHGGREAAKSRRARACRSLQNRQGHRPDDAHQTAVQHPQTRYTDVPQTSRNFCQFKRTRRLFSLPINRRNILTRARSVLLTVCTDISGTTPSTRPNFAKFYVHFACDSMTRSSSCLLYTSPSPRDRQKSRMPSSA